VKKIARIVDRLAVILPFEPEYYRGENLHVEYVGNPLLDEAKVSQSKEDFLRAKDLDPGRPVIGLFPGSRRNEIKYLLETIWSTAELLLQQNPRSQFLLPVAPSLPTETFERLLAERPLPVTIVRDDVYDVANACDAIIAVSGTVTLQIALVGTPMVVVYRVAPLTYAIGRRLVRIPFFSLVNIVAGEEVVREFLQDAATPEPIAAEIGRLLQDDEYRRRMRDGLAMVKEKMGDPGCSARVARMASEMSRNSGKVQQQ
jgi:lipid-A-disaccharide synthase